MFMSSAAYGHCVAMENVDLMIFHRWVRGFAADVVRASGGGRLIVQNDELISADGNRGVGSAGIVGKLDLENVRGEDFNNCADLPTQQVVLRQRLSQGDYVEQMNGQFHWLLRMHYST